MAGQESSRAALAELLRPELAELSSYVPHAGKFEIRLDANEAPPCLSDAARERVARALADVGSTVERYPDARAVELRQAIAKHSGVAPEEVLVGTGSDEVIALLLTALDRPRPRAPSATIVTIAPTFVMYRLSARARGMKVVDVPLDDAWDLAEASMLRAIELARPNLIFLASPNNPTGRQLSHERIDAVVRAAPDSVVVVDEAYGDYAPRSHDELRRYDNVVVLRTLSKVGFAGLRVGWAIGPAWLIAEVDKVRQPYNLPAPSQRAATVVLRELWPDVLELTRLVVRERERLASGLSELGLDVPPSHANFVWVGTRRPAKDAALALEQRGILVRSFHAAGGRLSNRLRVTVGRPEDNDRLLREMAECA
jgi:histidinol-phosphate aminotransferase